MQTRSGDAPEGLAACHKGHGFDQTVWKSRGRVEFRQLWRQSEMEDHACYAGFSVHSPEAPLRGCVWAVGSVLQTHHVAHEWKSWSPKLMEIERVGVMKGQLIGNRMSILCHRTWKERNFYTRSIFCMRATII